MTSSDLNAAALALAGWEYKYSAAKGENRWYAPDGHNYLLPPDFLHGPEALGNVASLEKLLKREHIGSYIHHLENEITKAGEPFCGWSWHLVTATPRQRLHALLRALKRGEFVCRKCGLRKDAEHEPVDF